MVSSQRLEIQPEDLQGIYGLNKWDCSTVLENGHFCVVCIQDLFTTVFMTTGMKMLGFCDLVLRGINCSFYLFLYFALIHVPLCLFIASKFVVVRQPGLSNLKLYPGSGQVGYELLAWNGDEAGVGCLSGWGENAPKAVGGDHPSSSRVLVIAVVGQVLFHGASDELNELSTIWDN